MSHFTETKNQPRPELEETLLTRWEKLDIFKKSIEQTANGKPFVFFEGPPTTNGRPGIHHVLSRVFKDIYIRYQTMQGRHVPRKAGWDCHGLPVEREVEKELGIATKIEIEEKYGVAEFNRLCRKSVMKYVGEWNEFTRRMAFFVDLDEPYFTMDNDYIESVWYLLKTIWDKKLIYQGYKVVPLDPVLGATMSDAEVDQGYKDIEDPSLTVKFKLKDDKRFHGPSSFLVWTTTPWTLPSNVGLAIHPEQEYALVQITDTDFAGDLEEQLIMGEALRETNLTIGEGKKKRLLKHKVIKNIKGLELIGIEYQQLLPYICGEALITHNEGNAGKKGFRTVAADFVTMESGTGIVHIAPAYGADDLEVGKEHKLPILHCVGMDGMFIKETPHAGIFFKTADKPITIELKEKGRVWKNARYKHSYPFGYRTGAPLLYFAKDAWYIKTTDIRAELMRNNTNIAWIPEHLKEGRFGNWLKNNRDWALSRERYWGTPLPIWTDGAGHFRVIGSVDELAQLSGKNLSALDLHRPHIDEIEFKDPDTGATMRRVPEVIDCWFDSGAMPYAQWGHPHKDKAGQFAKYFPADFISEAIDQTRGWFYTLLAISSMISGESSYKNVVCLGHVLDEKGEKMSKSKGNVVAPATVFDRHGADAIRWYFLTQAPPGNSRRVGTPGSKTDPVGNVHGFFNMLVNSLNFFILYANVDGIECDASDAIENSAGGGFIKGAPPYARRPEMDRWILSALQQLIQDVTKSLEAYNCLLAGQLIENFSDSLSNWYIRRNRRRFWKGELDADKRAAYDTLYTCLYNIAIMIAPFTPFLAEQISLGLQPKKATQFPESVHLAPWPRADFKNTFEKYVLKAGDLVKQAAYLGRAARMQSGVKVRQPLARLLVYVEDEEHRIALQHNREALLEELNVKELEFLDESAGIVDHRIKPNLPRLGKRVGKRMRELQKFFKDSNATDIVARLRRDGRLIIPAQNKGDQAIELGIEDVLIESVSREGTSGVEGDGMLVALDTVLSEELLTEGVARDLVRNIQELRKNSGLEVTDRIALFVNSKHTRTAQALQTHGKHIEQETLAELKTNAMTDVSGELTINLDDFETRIQIKKI